MDAKDYQEILDSEEKFVEYVYTLSVQNISGRETAETAFKLGIEQAYEDFKELLSLTTSEENKEEIKRLSKECMELTGKCKNDFEKWYHSYLKVDGDRLISGTDINFFNLLTDSMKWGVYVDFFDSNEIIVDVYKDPADPHYSVEIDYRVGYIDLSLSEARVKAIQTANEIYNDTK